MSDIRFLTLDGAPTKKPFSPAVAVGGFVFTSGQVPRDAERNILGDTMTLQAAATLENVQKALKAANATLTDVVQIRVHLSDLALTSEFNQVYAKFFGSHKPARTLVGSQLNGVMVEIDVIAYVSEK